MALLPLPPSVLSAPRPARTLVRPSRRAGVTTYVHEAEEPVSRIAPLYQSRWEGRARRDAFAPRPTFAAQLLALGLQHGVEGLIRRADDGNTAPAHAPRAVEAHYAAAHHHFAAEDAALFIRQA